MRKRLHNDITPQRALFKTMALYFGEARVGEHSGWRVVSDGSSPPALNEWRHCIIQRASPADSAMIYAPRQRRRGARKQEAAKEGAECVKMSGKERNERHYRKKEEKKRENVKNIVTNG